MNADAVTGSRRMCKRCGLNVIRVHTRPPQVNVDLAPTPCRDDTAVGPYFRRLDDDTFVQVGGMGSAGGVAQVPAGATLVPHHCAAPVICRHCEHVHQAPASNRGGNNNNNDQGDAS